MPKRTKPLETEIDGLSVRFRLRNAYWQMRYYAVGPDGRPGRRDVSTKATTLDAAKRVAREVRATEAERVNFGDLSLVALLDQWAQARGDAKKKVAFTIQVDRGRAKRIVEWYKAKGWGLVRQVTLQNADEFKIDCLKAVKGHPNFPSCGH